MPGKLLIVDDEQSIADILCETFEDEDIQSHALYCGNDAFEYVLANDVSLILSDIQMPNGTGIELQDKINQLEKPPKVMFMTGYSEFSKDELLKRGALEVFSKPVDLDELINKILNVLK
tara:strand:+ start:177 stop:533 length:357 start_codon:yes stop_codon:yes gene_type:complete